MPKINRISTLQYMGSKNRMLESICTPIIENVTIIRMSAVFLFNVMEKAAISSARIVLGKVMGEALWQK